MKILKYYAVYRGKSGAPKIFTSWDECKKEVIGFKGAIYKSFTSEKEAINFIALNSEGKSTGSAIVEENEEGLFIVDQHAAMERVQYEKNYALLKDVKGDCIELIIPMVLKYSANELLLLKESLPSLMKFGFEIEEFGGNEYKVTGIPAGLPKMDYKQLLIDVLDGLSEESAGKDPDIITEKVASMSCKAAVKGNNRLSFNEAFELMDELMKAENPYNCPHGRPTLIMMSRYEIEKKFKRIV